MTKINWFKEVLELEPGSKVFFPLARLYFEDGNLTEAMTTLRHGLDRNPDHLEARFMLVEILSRLEYGDAATEEVQTITSMLSRYPSFWKVWAENAAPTSKDSAMALTFLAANFQGSPISWSQIIERGLSAIFPTNGGNDTTKAKKKKSPPARRGTSDSDPNIRTKTMADLLADQGDFQGALGIYEELAGSATGHESDELEALIEKMRLKLKKGAPDSKAEPESLEMVDDVAVAPDMDFASDDDDALEFEPSGGAQPLDVPDIEEAEDASDFDAQSLLNDLLAGDDEDEDEGFEADLAAAPEPEFDQSPATEDVEATLDALEQETDALDADMDLDALDSDIDLDDLDADIDLSGLDDAQEEVLAAPEELDASEEPSGKDKLLQTLESLAERLEARAAS